MGSGNLPLVQLSYKPSLDKRLPNTPINYSQTFNEDNPTGLQHSANFTQSQKNELLSNLPDDNVFKQKLAQGDSDNPFDAVVNGTTVLTGNAAKDNYTPPRVFHMISNPDFFSEADKEGFKYNPNVNPEMAHTESETRGQNITNEYLPKTLQSKIDQAEAGAGLDNVMSTQQPIVTGKQIGRAHV